MNLAQDKIEGTSFTDKTGTVWQVVIDDEAIRRVAIVEKLNLLDLWSEPNAPQRLCVPRTFFVSLMLVCWSQYQAEKLTTKDFCQRITDVMPAACDALLNEYLSMVARKFPGMKDKVFEAMVSTIRSGIIKAAPPAMAN